MASEPGGPDAKFQDAKFQSQVEIDRRIAAEKARLEKKKEALLKELGKKGGKEHRAAALWMLDTLASLSLEEVEEEQERAAAAARGTAAVKDGPGPSPRDLADL